MGGRAYLMSPYTGAGCDIAASGIPFDISHAVVFFAVHEHEVGGQADVFGLVAFVVEVIEVKVRMLLDTDGSDNNEATLR